jgi:hypothetical protein
LTQLLADVLIGPCSAVYRNGEPPSASAETDLLVHAGIVQAESPNTILLRITLHPVHLAEIVEQLPAYCVQAFPPCRFVQTQQLPQLCHTRARPRVLLLQDRLADSEVRDGVRLRIRDNHLALDDLEPV